ncbi:hypothetical protein D0T23_14980 [Duganella sp. BJB475]|nr:hypothetical protein D0T23_14980 [Duganella sp. BJB475]RFP36413.1 hypothetical protein D0T21_08335 [Duganella sp. BJB476]
MVPGLLAGCRDKPAPAAPTPRVAVASQTAVGSHAPQPEGASDGEEVDVSQTLKGKDFTLEVYGSDTFRSLDISMADGQPVRQLRSMDGKTSELANITFAPGDNFELRELIPGDAHQQVLCKGSQLLSRGAGILDTYSLYRIEGDHLQELVSLVTERDVEEGNGFTPQKLHATVEETSRDGQPLIIYRVKAGKQAERTIELRWNGKLFEDPSGQYAKIAAEYIP